MEKEKIIIENISSNIVYYRQLHNLTQFELATKLNYSDKTISKWERAEGVPSIFVLNELANFFNISLNDLVNKRKVKPKQIKQKKPLLYSLIVWLFTTLSFFIIHVSHSEYKAWTLFVLALSASGLIFFIFNLVWHKQLFYNIALFVFLFGLATFIHLQILTKSYIFYLSALTTNIFISYLLYYFLE